MAATILFDQVGLPPGVAGRARSDGLDTGARVTVTNASGQPCRCEFWWKAPNDTGAALAQVGANQWEFFPQASRHGEYIVRLIEAEGTEGETDDIKSFGIRLPASGLLIPGLNSRGDFDINLSSSAADKQTAADISFNNEPIPDALAIDFANWWQSQRELYEAVEALVAAGGGAQPLSAVLATGNTSGANPIVMTASQPILSSGGDLTLRAGTGFASELAGGNDGGQLRLLGGAGTLGTGGQVLIQGASGASVGGNVALVSGSGPTPGRIMLASGSGSWVWPLADGSSGDVLTTDGAGGLTFAPGGGGGVTDFNSRVGSVSPEHDDYADVLMPFNDSTDFAVTGAVNCSVLLPGRFHYQMLRNGVMRVGTMSYDLGTVAMTATGQKEFTIQLDNLPVVFGTLGFGTLGGHACVHVGQEDLVNGGVMSWQMVPASVMFKQAGSVSGTKAILSFNLPSMYNSLSTGVNLFLLFQGILQTRIL